MKQETQNQHPLPLVAEAQTEGRRYKLSLMGDSHDPIPLLGTTPSGNTVAHMFVRDGKVYHVSYGIFCNKEMPSDDDMTQIKALCDHYKTELLQLWIDKYILHKNIAPITK